MCLPVFTVGVKGVLSGSLFTMELRVDRLGGTLRWINSLFTMLSVDGLTDGVKFTTI